MPSKTRRLLKSQPKPVHPEVRKAMKELMAVLMGDDEDRMLPVMAFLRRQGIPEVFALVRRALAKNMASRDPKIRAKASACWFMLAPCL
jgi:hypothetical protein